MQSKGHVPLRTCIVCGNKGPKGSLVRLAVRSGDGCLVVDHNQRMHGRGAYACETCIPQLRFNKRLQRAFRNCVKSICNEVPLRP